MSYYKTLTGSEPAEEAVVEPAEEATVTSTNKVLEINVIDDDQNNGHYQIAWKVLGNDFNGKPYLLSGNDTGISIDSESVASGHDQGMSSGKITISVNTNASESTKVRIYRVSYQGDTHVAVVSNNSTAASEGTRFDFPGVDPAKAGADKYIDVPLGTVASPQKLNIKLVEKTKGKFIYKWIGKNGEKNPEIIPNSVATLTSYNEITSDGTKVGIKRLASGDPTGSRWYTLSGNALGETNGFELNDIQFTGSDRSYFYAGKYKYEGATNYVTGTLPLQVANPLTDNAGNNDYTFLFNRYKLASNVTTNSSGSGAHPLSSDSIFEVSATGPIVSLNYIGTTNSAVIYGASNYEETGYTPVYLNDIDEDYVMVKGSYLNVDPTVTYEVRSVMVEGTRCLIDGSNSRNWTTCGAEGLFTLAIPKKVIKEKLLGGATKLAVTFRIDANAKTASLSDVTVRDSVDLNNDRTVTDRPNVDYSFEDSNGNEVTNAKYGDTINLSVKPKNKKLDIVSVNIVQKKLNDKGVLVDDEPINWTEASDIEALAKGDKTFTAGLDIHVKIAVKNHVYYEVHIDKDPYDEVKGTDGKYDVKYNVPVYIKAFNYDTAVGITSANVVTGDTPLKKGEAWSYETRDTVKVIRINGAKVSGNTINVSFTDDFTYSDTYMDLSKAKNVQTAEFAVTAADSTVKLKDTKIAKDGDKFPVGATRVYDLVVTGNIDLAARVVKNEAGAPTAEIVKNKLYVYTDRNSKSDYEGTVEIYDANEGATAPALCSVKIATEATTVAMKNSFTAKVMGKTNNTIGLSLKINKKISAFFAKDKNDNNTSIDGLYYLIEVEGDKAPSTTALNQKVTVAVPVTGADMSYPIDLKKSGIEKARLYEGDDTVNWNIKVRLIQTKLADSSMKTSPTSWDQSGRKIAESDAVEIKNVKTGAGQNFATKVTLKSTGATKKLYNNMGADNGYEISVVYNNGCGVQMLNRVELIRNKDKNHPEMFIAEVKLDDIYSGDALLPSANGKLKANNNKIQIIPGNYWGTNLLPGKYTVYAYATEPAGYEVVGKMTLNIVKANTVLKAVPEVTKIWKNTGKVATTKLNVYDHEGKITKKVEYTVIDGDQGVMDVDDPTTWPAEWNKKLAVISAITVKNGKITVNKNYTPSGKVADNQFRVVVKATDYKGIKTTTVTEPITVINKAAALKIENQKSTLSQKDQDSAVKGTISTAAYTTEEFFYDQDASEASNETVFTDYNGTDWHIDDVVNAKEFGKYRYFAILTVKNNDTVEDAVNFKYSISGGAKLLKFTPNALRAGKEELLGKAIIATNKPAKIKISGQALDGSKRTLSPKKLEVNVGYNSGKTRYTLYGYKADYTGSAVVDGSNIVSSNSAPSVLGGKNYGPSDLALTLKVFGATDDEIKKCTTAAQFRDLEMQLINATVKAKNATVKQTAPGVFAIKPTDTKVTITIKSKTNGDQSFTFTNPAVVKGKAAKITASNAAFGKADAKGKIYSHMEIPAANYGTGNGKMNPNTVKYAVDFSKLAVAGTKSVMVAVTKDDPINNNDFKAALDIWGGGGKAFYVKDLKDGAFTIDFINAAGTGDFSVKAGTYTLSVTPGYKDSKDGDVFKATGKAVTIKVVAAKAPAANIKLNTTLDFGAGGKNATAALDVSKSKNFFADGTGANGIRFGNDAVVGDDPYLAGVNTKGTINHFASAFSVAKDGSAYKIKFNGDAKCTSIDPKKDKTELNGWVKVAFRNLDGSLGSKWIKCKIKATGALTK